MPELKTLKVGEVQILPKTKTEAIIFDTPIEEISKESREIKEELNTINGEPITDIGQGLSKLVDTKKNLMTAIQGNGIQIDKTTPFDQYAEKISQITAGEPEVTYSVLVNQVSPDTGLFIQQFYVGNFKPNENVTLITKDYDKLPESKKSETRVLAPWPGWTFPEGINIIQGDTYSETIIFKMPHHNCVFKVGARRV